MEAKRLNSSKPAAPRTFLPHSSLLGRGAPMDGPQGRAAQNANQALCGTSHDFPPRPPERTRERTSTRTHERNGELSSRSDAAAESAELRQLRTPPETPRAPRWDRDRLQRVAGTTVLLSCYDSGMARCRGFIATVPFKTHQKSGK
ncbi:hypothetical protein fugu_018335 [Takifugu bimaculatus]|uniref:Uncharacterized protein n=1 Tax=Takifugu bimaculatus TaxID=433685 RepID=A0A4Z2BKU9_9TELE|nr:hypothetical protein fugu_018335 [Takifugu bimaculatus]